MKVPYLIQRINKKGDPYPDSTGVDKFFGFDYMGSAEFEFGALPDALKRMRKNSASYDVGFCEVQGNKACIVYSNKDDSFNLAVAILVDEMNGKDHYRFKERTEIRSTFMRKEAIRKYCGWWAIDADYPFVIFRNRLDADLWLSEIKKGKAT